MKQLLLYILLLMPWVITAQNWQTLGGGFNYQVRDFFVDSANNELYAIGRFTYAHDTLVVNQIAKWDGTRWHDLDSGNTNCYNCNPMTNVVVYQGDVYVVGQFSSISGIPNTKYMARFNGSNWESIGRVNNLVTFHQYNNKLLATGLFDSIGGIYAKHFALYDGQSWAPFDTSSVIGTNGGFIYCTAVYQGELYVGGNFDSPGGLEEIAKWDGTKWVSVGGGVKGNAWVEKMLVYKNELYVTGYFHKSAGNVADGIMKWDGQNWSQLNQGLTFGGGAQVRDMILYNNELLFIGFPLLADGLPVQNIAKWDGQKWCNFRNNYSGTAHQAVVYNNELIVACWDTMDTDSVNWIAKWVGGNQTTHCGVVSTQDELAQQNQISIYPNPSTGVFNIEFTTTTTTELVVYNLTGKEVHRQKISGSGVGLNLKTQPPGVYVVQLIGEQGSFFKKLVKH